MPVFNNILAGAAGSGGADAGYKIERSLRFDREASSNLSKTFASSGNTKKFTWSFWFKGCDSGNGASPFLIGVETDANNRGGLYYSSETLRFYSMVGGTVQFDIQTQAVYRDPSAWYHCVLAVDVDKSFGNGGFKIYINGVNQALTSAVYTQGQALHWNTASPHAIGIRPSYTDRYYSGYMADIHFVDGQQLDPDGVFGEFDADTGVWNPIEYTGGYDVTGGTTIAAATGGEPILNTSDAYGKTVSSGVRSDSNSSNIVLALPLNGSNNGTTITDYHHTIKGSGSAKTVSIYTGSTSGGAVTSTAESNYYGSSFYTVRGPTNNYTASDYIYRTGDSDLAFGTGSFCVEFWYKPGTFVQNSTMFDSRHNSTNWPNATHGFQFYTNHNGDLIFRTGSSNVIHVGQGQLEEGKWHHLAVTGDYSGSNRTIRIFRDGIQRGTVVNNNDFSEGRFTLGSAANNGEGSNGYYSDLRIYKGVAKYTSNFTVPDKPPGGVNGFHLDFSDNSSNAALGTDSSGNNNTWTVNNLTAQGDAGDPFTVYGSATNSGSSSAVSVSTLSTLQSTSTTSYATGSTAYNHLTADFGSVGNWKINADPFLSASTANITVYQSDNGTSWTSISKGQSPYSFSGRYIQWVRSGSGYGDQTLTAADTRHEQDSLLDSPTNGTQSDTGAGGEVSGNYATWSPLVAQTSGSITLSNGNLDTTCGSTRTTTMSSFPLTGKTYWEVTFGAGTYNYIGMTEATGFNTAANSNSGIKYTGYQSYSYGWGSGDGKLYKASNIIASPGAFSNGDVVGWAYDADNNTLKLYKNGSLQHTETGIADAQYFPAITHSSNNATSSANFGARSFAYAAPSGYKALCTTNLNDPLIADPSEYFDVKLYTGNGASASTTQAITGFSFSPDFLWAKVRSAVSGHSIYDTVRGITQRLSSSQTTIFNNEDIFESFDSNGFTVKGNSNPTNAPNATYVAWAWNAGSSTVSNTDGSITSSVRANPGAGFSIVSFENGSGTVTVGHGLNAVPEFIITKSRDSSNYWQCYHSGIGNGQKLYLNDPSAKVSSVMWGSTNPTSSVFTLDDGATDSWIAYCFAPVEGYSAFGSYVGTGSSPNFVYLGFRPALIITKNTGEANNWLIQDSTRNTYNLIDDTLYPNASDTEATSSSNFGVDFLSNGFALRTTGGFATNSNNASEGHTFIYAAFAENPFKYARAR